MIYTNKGINIISLILTCIIFLIINFCFFDIPKIPIEQISKVMSILEPDKEKTDENKKQPIDLGEWYIQIPAINLEAPIAEGTDSDTLNKKVGHFENTKLQKGNIGLAAHNRGYENNFFENLKNLKIDDKIIYTYKNYKKTFIVDTIEIIKNNDWSYLKNTEENKITLITCIDNEPNYRRCVQAVEAKI